MDQVFCILVINPGSTSTKIAVFHNEEEFYSTSIPHSDKTLSSFSKISDQITFRTQLVNQVLKENRINKKEINAIVGRGGLLRPIPGGTYAVNEAMVNDLEKGLFGTHASNLGGLIAFQMAKEIDVPAFIVDPVVVDEMEPEARISGMPDIERKSIFHALNHKAVAQHVARDMGQSYKEVNFIVAHLGGGISVGAHRKGQVIDVNNALNGDGPFGPERSGGLPAGQLVDLCFSGQYTQEQIHKRMVGNAGVVDYLGTNDMRQVVDNMEKGHKNAKRIYAAMVYQVAKEIGAMAAVLAGDVQGIILTGGLANDEMFVQMIQERVQWIARVFIRPGEKEMNALARGALKVLRGEEKIRNY